MACTFNLMEGDNYYHKPEGGNNPGFYMACILNLKLGIDLVFVWLIHNLKVGIDLISLWLVHSL